MAILCSELLNKAAELQIRFASCYTLTAADMDELVDLILAVNSCALGTNGRGILSTVSNPNGTFTITYTDFTTFTSADLTGPEGPIGPQGIQGVIGLAGADGTNILNGTAIPNEFVGAEGDFYIKTDTYDMYGPKTGVTWGVPVSLVGPAGADGLDGVGVPVGGTPAQMLVKIDSSDYNTQWVDQPTLTGGVGDMLKTTYDTLNLGIVDNAQKVNGLTVLTAVPSGALFTDTTYTAVDIKTLLLDNADTNILTDAELIDVNSISSKLASVVAGTNITIDNTDPVNPIINANFSASVTSVNNLTGSVLLGTDEIPEETNLYFTEARVAATPEVVANTAKIGITAQQTADIVTNNAKINDVVAGANVVIDISDPKNPIISLNTAGAGDMLASVYDPTSILGDAFLMSNMVETATEKILTDVERTIIAGAELAANKGVANGYASLDATAKVPASQLPSYVDDVLEFANLAGFPGTGEAGVIYVALDTNITYRWTGSVYVELSGTLDALTVKTLYESNANTNPFTDANVVKIDFITVTGAIDLDTILTSVTTNSLKVSATGFEGIDEGNGIGYVTRGRTAINYGNIGLGATDLGFSSGISTTRGATGLYSFNVGLDNANNGLYGNTTIGTLNIAGLGGTAHSNIITGNENTISTNSYSSAIFGDDNTINLIAEDFINAAFVTGISNNNASRGGSTLGLGLVNNTTGTVVVGQANQEFGTISTSSTATTNIITNALFVVGNGTVDTGTFLPSVKSNALVVLMDGTVTAPSITNALITTAGNKSLISKEYADATYSTTTTSLVNLTDTTIGTPALNEVLTYNGATWINSPGGAGGTAILEQLTAVGGETTFALANLIALAYKYQIYRNGQLLRQTIDYTLTHGAVTTVNFVVSLTGGEYIDVFYNDINAPGNLISTDFLNEGSTNLYYTEARVSANSNVSANTAKLAGIETNATADQTKSDIDALGVDSATVNGFTVLTGVPSGAIFTDTTYTIGDGGLTEISFTNADDTKLAGIEAGATADQTASEILTSIKTVDGPGSGLDADVLDGVQGSNYARTDLSSESFSGVVTSSATNATITTTGNTALITKDYADTNYGGAGGTLIGFALQDEVIPTEAGGNKLTFHAPINGTITEVILEAATAPVGAGCTVDINNNGATMLSTKLTIDSSEETSLTAAVQPVLNGSAVITKGDKITVDVDAVAVTTPSKGLKLWVTIN